jgi:uncharacterized protein with PIN domain
MSIHIDTSALAKRYVHEATSERFDRFVADSNDEFVLTPLIVTELVSALRKRLRAGEFDSAYLRLAESAFDRDLRDALWTMVHVEPTALASALGHGCAGIATSDRQLVRAAQLCSLEVHDFSS